MYSLSTIPVKNRAEASVHAHSHILFVSIVVFFIFTQ